MPDNSASDTSPVLSLPLIQPAQAQKHVTHNEALDLLDALVQTAVLSADQSDPPAAPAPGDMYIVGAGATADWAGQETALARYADGSWRFFAPETGWRAWVADAGQMQVFGQGGWQVLSAPATQSPDRLGINATADDFNRLTVSAPATLLTHEGASHRLKINKAAPADTASLLFQSSFSGRAEMGLAGSDSWSIRVSADGSNWTTALQVAASTGEVSGTAVQAADNDTTAGVLMKVGAFGSGLGQGANPAMTADADAFDLPSGATLYGGGGTANRPGGSNGAGIVWRGWGGLGSGKGEQHQLYGVRLGAGDDARLLYRSLRTDGTWADFVELLHRRNVVGPVSAAGGVPTGAVIEQGSNANGAYTRFADGTQICTVARTVDLTTTASGALYRDADAFGVWTFPASFAAPPVAFANVSGTDQWANVTARFGSYVSGVVVHSSVSLSAASHEVTVTALGRWT